MVCVCACTHDMSAGRCDSSPDSRSMPTVDLQWWLSSTEVFCTRCIRFRVDMLKAEPAETAGLKSKGLTHTSVPGRGRPGDAGS